MKTEKYKITVSEPWDYDGPNGPNMIHGVILKEVSANCVVFEADSELEFHRDKGRFLFLKSRYENEALKRSKNDDYNGVVGGGLILANELDAPPEVLETKSKYFLIGTLEKL